MALTQILLYITDDELVAFEWKDDTIVSSTPFSRDGKGIVQYGAYLTKNLELTFSILINTVEEEYKLETMAHVPKRQKELLKRYINKQYRGKTFKYGVIQGRETFGKKEDKLLLTTIGNDAFLTAWMQPLLDRKISISGIISLPLLTEKVIEKFDFEIERMLVVTRDNSVLRLTYMDNNKFKISRSIKSEKSEIEEIIQEIHDEIDKTLRYLGRIRVVFPDQRPEVVFISSNDLCEKVNANESVNNSIGKWTYCNSDHIRNSLDQHFDIMQNEYLVTDLYIHTLFLSKSINHYATILQTKFHISRSLRKPLELASAAFLVILSLSSAVLLIDSQVLDVRLQKLTEKIGMVESKLRIGQMRLPVYPISAEAVKVSVQAVDILLDDKPDIKQSLVVLSKTLSKFSNIELSYIQWSIVERDSIGVEIDAEIEDVDVEASSGDSTEMVDVDVDAQGEKKWVQVISITGRLNDFNGNYVAANNSVDKLVNELDKDRHFSSAIATKKPISSQADEKINGAAGKLSKQGEIAEFSLEVVINDAEFS